MKKLFALAIAIICVGTVAVLGASSTFGLVQEDGFVVPGNSGIREALAAGAGEALDLLPVSAEDVIYKRVTGYFIGEARNAVDVSFPQYVRGGAGLRFFDMDNWLITPEVDLLQTFNGLYLSEGVSYNIDMSRADEEEFIFLQLEGGLYMNLQTARFENRLAKHDIPTNSILLMSEDAISWYAYKNGTLGFFTESAVFDATLTVGGHTYEYYDLLEGLGLIREAIEGGENNQPDPGKSEEAEEVLKPVEKPEPTKPAPGEGDMTGDTTGDQAGSETQPGQPGPADPDQTGEGGQDQGQGTSPDPGDPGSNPGSGDQPVAPGGDDPETPGQAGGQNQGGTGDPTQGTGGDQPGQGQDQPDTGTGSESGSASGGTQGDAPPDPGEDSGDTGSGDPGQGDSGAAGGEGEAGGSGDASGDHGSGGTGGSGGTSGTGGDSGGSGGSSTGSGTPGAGEGDSAGEGSGDSTGDSGEGSGEHGGVTTDPGHGGTQTPGTGTGDPADGNVNTGDPATKPGETKPGEGGNQGSGSGNTNPNPDETQPGTGTGGDKPEGGSGDGSDDGDPDQEPEENPDHEELPDGTPDAGAKPVAIPYKEPVVTLSRFDPWCYALDLYMKVYDPSAAITRGVKFAVYGGIKGSGATTTVDGHTVYPQDKYTGQVLMLRKTRSGSQHLALDPLEPGRTVYIQYTYRYYAEDPVFDDKGQPVMDPDTGKQKIERRRVNYNSDFIQVEIPKTEDCQVQPLGMGWTTAFAANVDALSLRQMSLQNLSAYDAEAAKENYTFANFKLNTLPYASRLEVTLTPLGGGEPTVLSVSSSVLQQAQKKLVDYTSSTPKLNSNSGYTMKVRLLDRYGNLVPAVTNGLEQSTYVETVHTQKRKPVVTVTEVSNIMDQLTLGFQVSDPDSALDSSAPLVLTMSTQDGKNVILKGSWKDGTPAGSDTAEAIELPNPRDGATYELTLDSLAFARLFTARVSGKYLPQPDGVTEPMLQPIDGAVFGQLQVYTAALSSGQINFITSFSAILDRSATLNISMTTDTTMEILPLVDQLRVYLKDPAGKVVQDRRTVLDAAILDDSQAFPYQESAGAYILEEGSFTAPSVKLVGKKTQDRGNPWQSLLIHLDQLDDGNGGVAEEYSQPMQLQIAMPDGFLTNFTKYDMVIEAVVIKGGEEYTIPVKMTNNLFTTKKIIPTIAYEDLFVASDIARFVGLHIIDPDKTIQNGGVMTAELYYGDTCLSVQRLTADQSPDSSGPATSVTFDGLMPDAAYTIKFVAAAYNDEEGYGAYRQNYVLETYSVVGGSDLQGSLNLQSLKVQRDQSLALSLKEQAFEMDDFLPYTRTLDGSSKQILYKYSTGFYTYVIPVEPNTTYEIFFNNPKRSYFYYGWLNTTAQELQDAVDRVSHVTSIPDSIRDEMARAGIPMLSYSSTRADSVRWTSPANATHLAIGFPNSTEIARDENNKLVYMYHYDFFEGMTIRLYDPASTAEPSNAEIAVTVTDKKGYLGRENDEPFVTFTVERSEGMYDPVYAPVPERSGAIPLEKLQEDSPALTAELVKKLDGLDPGCAWRVTLTATYQNQDIQLDQIEFRSDGDYITVYTHQEFIDAVNYNPYGNILVASDFEQNVRSAPNSFYGTIDFQGHVVTRVAGNPVRLINNLYQGSHVRNLVYDYPNQQSYVLQDVADAAQDTAYSGSVFYAIHGTVENVIIRTYGALEIQNACQPFYIFYPSATLRNFIFQLGGDVLINAQTTWTGLVMYSVYGTIENGYIYGKNQAGILQVGTTYSGIFPRSYFNGIIRNFYVIADNWQRIDDGGQLFTPSGFLMSYTAGRATVQNAYTVGDFYAMTNDLKKSYLVPLSRARMTYTGYGTSDETLSLQNVWALTSRQNVDTGGAHRSNMDKLYDLEWQKSLLGDAFDVEECVSMGFYPRLQLPDCMQKYQEYLSLPLRSTSTTPTVVNDGWADTNQYGKPQDNNGYVRLRLKNDVNAHITGVTIEGLKVETVLDQKMAADGLYDVVIRVQVDPDPAKTRYASSYHITALEFTTGSVKRTATQDYDTQGIEFWKTVSTVTDWSNINANMAWNYRLANDIDFGNATYGEIVINGYLNDFTSYSTRSRFTGKLDGAEHVISGISLENCSAPYVIAYVYGGTVENLFIDDLYIKSTASPKQGYSGFVAQMANGVLKNVRMKNSTLLVGGQMGPLVGYASNIGSTIEGCSVTDTLLQDFDTGATVYAGGIVGYGSASIRGCYTRNLEMDITNANSIMAVGGITGWRGSNRIENCYTHGSITTASSNVGGLFGTKTSGDTSATERCISYVRILQTSGDYAGGVTGNDVSTAKHIMVLGDVSGAGANTNRISVATANFDSIYAWEGQQVTGRQESDRNWAAAVFTGPELGKVSVWQNLVQLGRYWDYEPVRQGQMPQLSAEYDTAVEGWSQTAIPLPGQGSDPWVELSDSTYLDGPVLGERYSYNLTFRLYHPTLTGQQFRELALDEQGRLKPGVLDLRGMDLSQARQEEGNASLSLTSSATAETPAQERYTLFTVLNNETTLALDSYALTVAYNDGEDREIVSMVTYRDQTGVIHINWLEIENLSQWNQQMPRHGTTEENIKITGVVDFNGATTTHVGLKFNRLAGVSRETTGFKDLHFNGTSGNIWIEKVAMDVSDLFFESCEFNYGTAGLSRAKTGAILSTYNANRLKIKDLTMACNASTRGSFAFISYATGTIDDVIMENIRLSDSSTSGTANFAAGLVADTPGNVLHVKATNVTVNMPRNYYVGAVVGRASEYHKDLGYFEVTGVNISGYYHVGGAVGYSLAGMLEAQVTGVNTDQMPNMNKVLGTYKHATAAGYTGGVAGFLSSLGNPDMVITVKDMLVTGNATIVGGVAGGSTHVQYLDTTVQNTTVTGPDRVGGVTGNSGGYPYYRNVQVIGCTVEATGTGTPNADVTYNAAGGVIGYYTTGYSSKIHGVVVRDTTVTGLANVGGFMGVRKQTVGGPMEMIYIAEDVVVHARGNNSYAAGGVIGWANRAPMNDVICGATVMCDNQVAGGIVGHLEVASAGNITVTMNKVVSTARVSATTDYAGGLVGKLNSSTVLITEDLMKNCLFTGSVVTSGKNNALWVNDTAETGAAGRASVYVWEGATLNGQDAGGMKKAADALGITSFVLPETSDGRDLLVTAAQLTSGDFYTDTLGFTDTKWDLSHLAEADNVYMPYTLDLNGEAVLYYANHNEVGAEDGILLPIPGSLPTMAVYAAGVDRINIEVPVAEGAVSATVTVDAGSGEQSFTTNGYGQLSLGYDFKTDLVINGRNYTAADLARTVLTWTDNWYYVADDGSLVTGLARGQTAEMRPASAVTGITGKVLHLWQGRALTESGIYILGGSTVLGDALTPAEHMKQQSTVEPFWYSNGISVYHNYTVYEGNRYPYRIFMMGDTPYTVSPTQQMVYDGIVLSKSGSGSATRRFFATLSEGGKLHAWLSDMLMREASPENIAHMSNNLGYDGTVLMLRYTDGTVIGVDYTTGDTVVSTVPALESVLRYGVRAAKQMLTGQEQTTVLRGAGYEQSESTREELEQALKLNGTGLGTGTGDGVGGGTGTSGFGGIPGLSGPTGPGQGEQSEEPELVEGLQPDSGTGAAGSGSTGTGNVGADVGTGDVSGTAGSNGNGDQTGTGNKTGTGDQTGTGGPEGTDLPAGTGKLPDGSTGGSGDQTGTGENAGSPADQPGKTEPSGDPDDTGAQQDSQSGSLADAKQDGEQLKKLLGSSLLVYSPEAGRYIPVHTETIGGITGPETLADSVRRQQQAAKGDLPTLPQPEKPNKDLDISHGIIDRTLYEQEKQGFVLIGVAAAIGIAALGALCLKVIRKRKF